MQARTPRSIALMGVVLVLTATALTAQAGPHTRSHSRDVPISGLMPTRAARTAPRLASFDRAHHLAQTVDNLQYHGGPVMRTNSTYAIYWRPRHAKMSASYRATIDQYFNDVAADSGAQSNVYSVETQYGDGSGLIAYSQAFGGSVVDTHRFPSNGCPAYGGLSACINDKQVRVEVKRVVANRGWPVNTSNAYFLFLPKNVGTCADSAGLMCAFTYFCGYHSAVYVGASPLIYSNEPYAETKASCTLGTNPNGNEADSTINTASHEHREMINDPTIDAWYDSAGNEGSDKCAWKFGASTSNGTGQYNQVINDNDYFIQEEWSNTLEGCALSS